MHWNVKNWITQVHSCVNISSDAFQIVMTDEFERHTEIPNENSLHKFSILNRLILISIQRFFQNMIFFSYIPKHYYKLTDFYDLYTKMYYHQSPF